MLRHNVIVIVIDIVIVIVIVIALGHLTGSNLSDVAAQSIFVHLQSPESWKTRS